MDDSRSGFHNRGYVCCASVAMGLWAEMAARKGMMIYEEEEEEEDGFG